MDPLGQYFSPNFSDTRTSRNVRADGHYPRNTTRSFASHLKDSILGRGKSGVYRLWCDSCPAIYIGQTSRQFSTRLSEHLRAFAPTTTLVNRCFRSPHLLNTAHTSSNPHATIATSSSRMGKNDSLSWRIIEHIHNPAFDVLTQLYENKVFFVFLEKLKKCHNFSHSRRFSSVIGSISPI